MFVHSSNTKIYHLLKKIEEYPIEILKNGKKYQHAPVYIGLCGNYQSCSENDFSLISNKIPIGKRLCKHCQKKLESLTNK